MITGWGCFWIGWFTYEIVKYVVNKLTYNRNKAIKELAREQYNKAIKEEIKKLKFGMKSKFDEVYDRVIDMLDLIIDEKIKR